MKTTAFILTTILVHAVGLPGQEQQVFDVPNHHLHNFGVNERTYEHAVAMGYRLVSAGGNVDRDREPEYRRIGLIRNHNSHICPLRVHVLKSDGQLFVTYHDHVGTTAEGLNPIALMNGIRRRPGGDRSRQKMDADDLRLLKGYGAAKRDLTDLTMQNVTYEEFQKRFYTSWPLEDAEFKSCNVLCNWQSRKVVEDMILATLENIAWRNYDALFFDSLSGGPAETVNAEFGGRGTYPTGMDGKLAFVRTVVQFVRDPAKTGCPRPYLVFTNIYDPLGKTLTKTWYGTGQLRLDHYYFEKGSKDASRPASEHAYKLGTQYANGVVPGTRRPAYVNRDETGKLIQPEAYLPANLVALDDAYTWSMRVSRRGGFDHAAFFDQHLDACGTAGIQGSWFGWYGEDTVTIKDTEGRLIYTNACQLLRAIPNWDNMRYVPIPPFQDYSPTDQRAWDRKVYRSPYSYASHDVIYSRNPDNEELYAVFRSAAAVMHLLSGETPVSACFVNPWFSKTSEDALSSLQYDAAQRTIRLTNAEGLNRGVRIVTTRTVK